MDLGLGLRSRMVGRIFLLGGLRGGLRSRGVRLRISSELGGTESMRTSRCGSKTGKLERSRQHEHRLVRR